MVLSGTGSDGTLGLKAIKAHAGMTMAQEAESAKYAGMPGSAIRSGAVDYVRPAGAMVEQIRAFLTGAASRDAERVAGESPALGRIFVALRDRTGHDFSVHKASTSRRRIERRMNVHQIGTIEEYLRYLQINPEEVDALFRELLIGVTSFFRDSGGVRRTCRQRAAEAPGLQTRRKRRARLGPGLLDGRGGVLACDSAPRVPEWPGALAPGPDLRHRSRPRGHRDGAGRSLPERHRHRRDARALRRWFVQEDGHYRVKKDIRDLVIFAPHDLLKDPPFTKLDLLSCRNLLIYVDSRAQRRLMPLFHYALRPAGLLFLGAAESIDQHEGLFSTVDRKWKIFRRANARRQALEGFPIGRGKTRLVEAALADRREASVTPVLAPLVERMLLARAEQSGVVVDKRGETLYVAGRAGEYLQPEAGEPTHRLLRMAREGLRQDLAAVLREAAKTQGKAVRRGVRVAIDGDVRFVDIAATPIIEPTPLRGLLLVTFEIPSSARAHRLRPDRRPARGARHASEAFLDVGR